MDKLFGPLDVRYCEYYYYMAVFYFIVFCMGVIIVVSSLFKKEKIQLEVAFLLLSQPIVAYFVSRLSHTICVRSLNKN